MNDVTQTAPGTMSTAKTDEQWILDVLCDLELFCRVNGMVDLHGAIVEAHSIARQELGRTRSGSLQDS